MKRDRLLQHTLVAFGIALLVYVTFYTAIEHRRSRAGPWQVTFTHKRNLHVRYAKRRLIDDDRPRAGGVVGEDRKSVV